MKALLIYESMFGNTKAVAEAVARGLQASAPSARVELAEIGAAPAAIDSDVELVIVGAPTHALTLSRPKTRQDAATRTGGEPLVSSGEGAREWLARLPAGGTWRVATFDTRIAKPRLPGSAARAAQRRLRRAGHRPIAPAESYWVTGVNGPLVAGELDRATQWGRHLGELISATEPAELQP